MGVLITLLKVSQALACVLARARATSLHAPRACCARATTRPATTPPPPVRRVVAPEQRIPHAPGGTCLRTLLRWASPAPLRCGSVGSWAVCLADDPRNSRILHSVAAQHRDAGDVRGVRGVRGKFQVDKSKIRKSQREGVFEKTKNRSRGTPDTPDIWA